MSGKTHKGMEIRPFIDSDYSTVCAWYHGRNKTPVPKEFLPRIGFVVDSIAMGFLMQTDSNLCILEPFIANPEAPSPIRDEALKMVLSTLVATAANMGYKAVFGFSTSTTMVQRALSQGFKLVEVNATVMKELI